MSRAQPELCRSAAARLLKVQAAAGSFTNALYNKRCHATEAMVRAKGLLTCLLASWASTPAAAAVLLADSLAHALLPNVSACQIALQQPRLHWRSPAQGRLC
eukprot:GHRQ01031155.1.p2 GENE.GHRQ01031155.1~~GHRQ01031155.1.p2  ORF type:complete len:102 (+),score=14.02 GHRQ01031155.1:1151-1456(+)